MADFVGGSDHPFSVHTASRTLLGRSDIHLPSSSRGDMHRYDGRSDAACNTVNVKTNTAACNTGNPRTNLGMNIDSPTQCDWEKGQEERWVSSPRRTPAYRDTKTSSARTKKGQSLIPPGGNIRPVVYSCNYSRC
jgi:hypothetical protein